MDLDDEIWHREGNWMLLIGPERIFRYHQHDAQNQGEWFSGSGGALHGVESSWQAASTKTAKKYF